MIDVIMQVAQGIALVSITLTVGCYGGVKLATIKVRNK